MKISGEEYLKVIKAYETTRTKAGKGVSSPTPPSPATPPADRAEFSQQAQEIRAVAAKIKDMPDVREDIVASLRERIQNGTYNVDSKQVAEMILRRTAADSLK
ncbi:MAG: flagellar biosynthesis anti-sigma factor FlgM [Armatimonadetes bacterium]|nr:flagellar biosynthesis anti-sigma factor FlgM [Armatimonadota bacterium]